MTKTKIKTVDKKLLWLEFQENFLVEKFLQQNVKI